MPKLKVEFYTIAKRKVIQASIQRYAYRFGLSLVNLKIEELPVRPVAANKTMPGELTKIKEICAKNQWCKDCPLFNGCRAAYPDKWDIDKIKKCLEVNNDAGRKVL